MPLGTAHTEIHLYHASKAPIVVYSEAAKQSAMYDRDGKATGYGITYIPQDYPKMVKVGEDRDGNAIQRSVANEEEEKTVMLGLLPPVVEVAE